MPNYPMNVGEQGQESDRTMVELGFNNIGPYVGHNSEKSTVPYEKPAPLTDAVIMSSDTQKIELGPSAGDITMRTR